MRKPILSILISFFTLGLMAQTMVSVSPNPKFEEGLATTTVIAADVTVKNESDQELTLLWRRVIIQTPQGWLTQICDKRLCYLPEVSQCPEEYPNVLAPGEEIEMRVDVLPQGVVGEGEIHVELFESSNPDEILATIVTHFTTTSTSVAETFGKADLKLYPNPTSDYFRLNNTSSVSKLQIYNIVGNAVREFYVSGNESYPVADLPQGMYLVRMYDKNNQVLKTVRLSKR